MILLLGDCLEQMKTLPDCSVDAVVTDPPYGLSFMGKAWDYDVPQAATWREALRVLKPGGHLLSFFGSRTYHRGAVAIEDAGFEIRDQIMWVYGSGFPKSMDIGKAIDKAAGVEREVIETIPDRWAGKGNVLTRATQAEGESVNITAPATPEAQQWNGWGTALKPSHEPVVVARKPLIGTVAENVLKYGTGGVNVDGCRIAASDGYRENAVTQGVNTAQTSYAPAVARRTFAPSTAGRWPANLIHDGSDEVVGLFPQSKDGVAVGGKGRSASIYGTKTGGERSEDQGYGGGGPAARFFYTAKTSKSERGKGNHHPTVKPIALMRYLCRLVTPPGGVVLDPFMGSGSTGKAALLEGFNFIGIERDPQYFAIAEARVNNEPIPVDEDDEAISEAPQQQSLFDLFADD